MHSISNTKINNKIIYKKMIKKIFYILKKIMENLKKFSENNDIELSIVYLPTYRYFINNVYQNPYYDSIKDILKDLEMNLIDLNELVLKREQSL